MKREDRRFIGIVACIVCALTAALAIAGCSSGSGSSSTTTAASSASADTSSYTTVESGKLIVASDLAYPPLESVPDGGGDPVGFDVDLMNALAGKLGLTCEYLPAQKFDSIVPTIKQGGKADVGCSSFTITDERKEEIDFTDSYMDSNQGLVTKSDATATTVDALNVAGKQIAVQSGTTGEEWAQENLPNATVVPLDDAIQAMTGVQTGLYDACVADLPVMKYLCNNSYTDLKVSIEIPTGEQYGIVVSKDNPGLTAALNTALQELKDDGTIDSLEEKWFGSTM
ncbi:MAG: ABC transporter substrate-binding protein [Atopobiaceae bacterium]|jgi:polar amino acid transport system substrate-binding protein|nr:ABC transporter substrate-binding protein [Atopobiaceae bacterium]MCI2174057.1 ABC transporter substrate-binding protein [Atopobiaceae bacterium]MCI2207853.1 ABC transporter substrate-binding protein [Atopobiaceae bacterium]